MGFTGFIYTIEIEEAYSLLIKSCLLSLHISCPLVCQSKSFSPPVLGQTKQVENIKKKTRLTNLYFETVLLLSLLMLFLLCVCCCWEMFIWHSWRIIWVSAGGGVGELWQCSGGWYPTMLDITLKFKWCCDNDSVKSNGHDPMILWSCDTILLSSFASFPYLVLSKQLISPLPFLEQNLFRKTCSPLLTAHLLW